MSSTSHPFARALSPMHSAIASASSAPAEDKALARRAAYQGAATVDELIAMVPSDYRQVLREPLLKVASYTDKLCSARRVLLRYEQHKAAGTFPPSLSAKAPTVQLTKEFSETPEAAARKKALEEGHQAYLVQLLANAIAAKQDDVLFLEKALTPEALLVPLQQEIMSHTDSILKGSKVPRFGPDPQGSIGLLGWEENTTAIQVGTDMLNDALYYAFRVRSIVESREQAAEAKLDKKKAVAKAADVEMADGTKPGPSIQSLIDKAVSASLKKVRAPVKNVSRFHPYSHSTANDSSSCLEQNFEGWQEEIVGPIYRQVPRQEVPISSSSLRSQSWTKTSQDRSQEERRQGLGQAEGQECRAQEVIAFRYDRPTTYPDWLLNVPLPQAVRYVILNTPLEIVEAAQFKNHVHRSPGVTLPEDIEYQLSVGMRYMFHSPRRTALISQAWRDFQRRLRWRLLFAFTKEEDDLYDPEYEVAGRQSQIEPPRLPTYLELGLVAGRRFVNKTIANIPPETDKDIHKSLAPSPRLIQEFLFENDLVVTNTDKNLGIAVSKRTWIIEKSRDILADQLNYKEIMLIQANQICDYQCTEMELLAGLAEAHLSNGKQIAAFLRSKITLPKSQHTVPRFYGIPKIHKEPVKMRPIVPCHSAIQNPAAKYVSKRLKPIVESAPTIIHGSKDLAQKLSKVKLLKNRRWFIVTGDVVAFYPNIPLKRCLDIVTDLHAEFYYKGPVSEHTIEELSEEEIFIRCIKIANNNLVLQYEDKFYKQQQGLAMGVACSPDLANLYGWYFERELNILNHPLIPFYGRYIDDCLAIVYASSDKEALNIVSQLAYDNCTIEWNVSDHFQPFLDMTIYHDNDNSIQHMPYRKARNHQERIPWISHHPLDVKRGTYIGEMSRLATLSSKIDHYSDAIKALAALYVKRGYPYEMVSKWTKENFATRWQRRLDDTVKSDASDVLVLKSEYNTAWNYFSAKELGDTVLGYWRDYIVRAELGQFDRAHQVLSADDEGLSATHGDLRTLVQTSNGPSLMPDIRKINILNRRMIVSRKRTRNLFDLTSLWKKTVVTTLEHDIVNESSQLNDDEIDLVGVNEAGLEPGDLEYVYYRNVFPI